MRRFLIVLLVLFGLSSTCLAFTDQKNQGAVIALMMMTDANVQRLMPRPTKTSAHPDSQKQSISDKKCFEASPEDIE